MLVVVDFGLLLIGCLTCYCCGGLFGLLLFAVLISAVLLICLLCLGCLL